VSRDTAREALTAQSLRAVRGDAGKQQAPRALVRIENVSKEYRLGEQVVPALHRINLNIEQGVFMVVAGPSGSG
jgi:ABC-type glutathione transport system ATPase component